MAEHVLDTDGPIERDPMSGARIGACEIVCRLSPGSFLAIRYDFTEGTQLVVLRKVTAPPATLAAALEQGMSLRDPRLSRVFGTETSEEGTFWVSEFVGGATLEQIRTASKQKGAAFPMGIALPAISDAAQGLQLLHATQGPK